MKIGGESGVTVPVVQWWITVKKKSKSFQNFDSLQSVGLNPAATATSNKQSFENI